MTESKHTPGPWWTLPNDTSARVVKGTSDDYIHICLCSLVDNPDGSANTALIARAPDMAAEIEKMGGRINELEREIAEAANVAAEAREYYSLSAGRKPGTGLVDIGIDLFGHDETIDGEVPCATHESETRALVKAAHSIVIDWNSDRQVYENEIKALREAMNAKSIRALSPSG